MSHEVERMVFAGATPWHGLGTPIEDDVKFWDAFELAGLNWQVTTEPLFRANGEKVPAQASVRDSDNSVLGVVGPRWTPLQNSEAFQVFEPLIESGDMRLHTAGSLRQGQRVWVLCQLNMDNSEVVKGDEIAKFALLSNGHDGKLAVHFGFTPIRVVCANTEAMARRDHHSSLIRVRHHRFVKENVESLREIMNVANAEFETTLQQYRLLASKPINSEDLEKYIKIVLDLDKKKDDDISTRSKNIIREITGLFETGKGSDLPGVRGTYWAGYNALSEYLNYSKGRNAANRLDALWFGTTGTQNEKALETALTLAG